jgi:tetratricopeptide (TPR) repeat protein
MNRKQRRVAGKLDRSQSSSRAGLAIPVSSTVTELLAEGLQHYQAGRLVEAEGYYRRVLNDQPNHADALHLLGVIVYRMGHRDRGVELIRQAIQQSGQTPIYFYNLGKALSEQGKLDEAVAAYRRAIQIKPDYAEAYSNLGLVFKDLDKLDEAVAAYRQAIQITPDYAEAHSNLGIVLTDQGKLGEAVAAFHQAIQIKPDSALAYSNLGVALKDQGKLDEAVVACRQAIGIKPDLAQAHSNLGNVLKDQDKLDEAVAAYHQAIQIKPDYALAHSNLGGALKVQGKLDEAVAACREAIDIKPDLAEAHFNLGDVLIDQGKLDEAVAAYRQAIQIKPGYAEAYSNLGVVLEGQGKLDEAVAACRQAILIKPDLAATYSNLGHMLKELGQLHEAQEAYFEAIQLDPSLTRAYFNLADSMTFAPGDRYLTAMEALAAKTEGLSKTDRTQLDFALGKAYADLKDYRRSFKHLLAGNAGKRATIYYEEKSALALFDRIEAVFTSELVKAKSGGGDGSPLPIFVLGMPRSGTTLVEQIIASHPMAYGAGELQTLTNVARTVCDPDGNAIPFPEFMPALDVSALRQIGTRYVTALRELAPKGERVTDKMPSNYYFAGLIHLALPNAKIIHTMRDPIDTCISCFSKLFSGEQNHTYDLGELGRYYKRYERLMAHWRRALPPSRILDVQYEDVVADLEGQAQRIISYCGLPWDDRCLAFHKTDRPVRTASATQVRQPIYKSAVGRSRLYETQLGPLLAALGVTTAAEA